MTSKELKLGIVGLDGHGPVFAGEVNSKQAKIQGMKVVTAMPVPSVMISKEQLEENITKTEQLGIEITDSADKLAEQTDGILILHDDGSKHLELTETFARFGKPIFVDKPLEANADKARQLADICKKNQCPVFTASSLRFTLEMKKAVADSADDKICSAMTYSPFLQNPSMPGWIYYGIHAVEPLYTLLGPGCSEVSCIAGDQGPVAIGKWKDGRLGIAKAVSKGPHEFGFTVWREKSIDSSRIDIDIIYDQLLKEIKEFFLTAKSPVDIEESIEVISFMEAANKSMSENGKAIPLVQSKQRA